MVADKGSYRKMMMSVIDRSSFPTAGAFVLNAVRFGSRMANKIDDNPMITNWGMQINAFNIPYAQNTR
jgi:hypothetical protein